MTCALSALATLILDWQSPSDSKFDPFCAALRQPTGVATTLPLAVFCKLTEVSLIGLCFSLQLLQQTVVSRRLQTPRCGPFSASLLQPAQSCLHQMSACRGFDRLKGVATAMLGTSELDQSKRCKSKQRHILCFSLMVRLT